MARINRRALIQTAGGAAAITVLDARGLSWAQQQTLVVKTFTGQWNRAVRETTAVPFEKATGVATNLVAINSVEALARLRASPDSPPYDVLLIDEGPRDQAIEEKLLLPIPSDRIAHTKDIYPELQVKDGYGPRQSCSVMGLAYDPKRVKRPESWADLWSPEYKGELAINPGSATLGTAFLVVAARLNGGDESKIEPGFAAMKRLLASVVSIPKTPAVLATLFERGEVAVAPLWNTNTLNLKEKGVSVDWVAPKEGAVGSYGHAEIAKNSKVADAGLKFINQLLSVESQTGMAQPPYFSGPVNQKVSLSPEVAKFVPSTLQSIRALQSLDWSVINKSRDEWLNRWDREITL
jgi:putative spermidine/putrescine transport system substrate-binding protein